jgi:hypothetical protein
MIKRAARFASRALVVLSVSLGLGTACAGAPQTRPLPALPPEYYQAAVATPADLVYAYYSKYMVISEAEVRYNNMVFVFKNITVTDKTFAFKKDGYIQEDQIKCFVPDIMNDAKCFQVGDRIDIVGRNLGDKFGEPGLILADSYILPAGAVALPAPGEGLIGVAVY